MKEKIRAHPCGLQTKKNAVNRWQVPKSVMADVLDFVADLELGKVNRGRKTGEAAQAKYLDMLKISLEYFNKPIARITLKDVERFEQALTSNQIQSRMKKAPYSEVTKVDLRKALKAFLRWRLGEAKGIRLAGWLDTRDRPKTPDFLTEPEVDQLYRKCHTAEQRYMVALLFDSGARAEEFLNIRCEDIRIPEGKENFVKLTLKEEYSKTKGRTISLYWRHSAIAVLEYFKERIAQGIKAQDPVFDKTYDAMRMFLSRLGRKVLDRHVHPHLFRHSSATYYATKLNRQELCYRYGWRFSSNMPDVYISRAGMESKELDQKFTATELSTVKDQLVQVEQSAKIKDDRIAQLEKTIVGLQASFSQVAEVLKLNPSVADVEAAIQRKKKMR